MTQYLRVPLYVNYKVPDKTLIYMEDWSFLEEDLTLLYQLIQKLIIKRMKYK